MPRVYKIGEYYLAGVEHEIPGYVQDVIFVFRKDNKWTAQPAESFKTEDKTLAYLRDKVKFATLEEDIDRAVEEAKRHGISVELVRTFPFPSNLLKGRIRIQEEID